MEEQLEETLYRRRRRPGGGGRRARVPGVVVYPSTSTNQRLSTQDTLGFDTGYHRPNIPERHGEHSSGKDGPPVATASPSTASNLVASDTVVVGSGAGSKRREEHTKKNSTFTAADSAPILELLQPTAAGTEHALQATSHTVVPTVRAAADDDDAENDLLPLELLANVFAFLGQRTLLLSVPAVCRRWRLACQLVRGMRIDLSFLPPTAAFHRALNPDLSEQYSEDYENPYEDIQGHDACYWEPGGAGQGYAMARNELFKRFEREADVAQSNVARWLSGMAERFPQITSVVLSGNDLADRCLAPLAQHCQKLEHIEVSNSTAFTGKCLAELAKGCPHLSSVTVRHCKRLERECVNALAKSCPKLKSIEITTSGVDNYSDALCVPISDSITADDHGGDWGRKKTPPNRGFPPSSLLDEVEHFADMNLREELLRGMHAYGFETPSPIQQRAIVPCIKGHDIIVMGPGTGKTATIAITVLQKINTSIRGPCQALILAPTNELVDHIHEVIVALGEYTMVECMSCIGGTHVADEMLRLESGVHCIVGTPDGVFDMISRGTLKLNNIRHFVLHEFDETMPPDLVYDRFFRLLSSQIQVITRVQVIVLSATMAHDVLRWTRQRLPDPLLVFDGPVPLPAERSIVANLAQHCPRLVSVACTPSGAHIPTDEAVVTDRHVELLASACPDLRTVNFAGCKNLTDCSVTELGQRCPQLTSIDFSGCKDLTDCSVAMLAANRLNLQSVRLNGCKLLTLDGLTDLVVVMHELTTIESDVGTWALDYNVVPEGWENVPTTKSAGRCHLRTKPNVPTAWANVLAQRCPPITSMKGHFTDSILADLAARLNHLEEVDADGLNDAGVELLAQHSGQLRRVNIGSPGTTDMSVVVLARKCPELTSVSISASNITDVAVIELARWCHGLTRLELTTRSVTDRSLEALAQHCSQLKSLSVNYNKSITDVGIVALARGCTLLASVNVSDHTQLSTLTDDSVVALATHCPRIADINIAGCRVTTDMIHTRDSALTDRSVRALAARFIGLDHVTFDGCDGVTADSVLALAEHCPRQVDIRNSAAYGALHLTARNTESGITRFDTCAFDRIPSVADAEVLARACPLLTSISARGGRSSSPINSGAIAAFAQDCPRLQRVDVDKCDNPTLCITSLVEHCHEIRYATVGDVAWTAGDARSSSSSSITVRGNDATDATVEAVARGCSSAASFTVKAGAGLTDHALEAVSTLCTNLTDVDLCACPAVTDQGFVAIVKNCQQLKSVKIEGCPSIGPLCVRELGQHCPQLTVLQLKECSGLTDDDVDAFARGCTNLETVDFERCELLTGGIASTLLQYCTKLFTGRGWGGHGIVRVAGQVWSSSGRTLSMQGSETTDAIATLASRVNDVATLAISHCPQLTDGAIASLSLTWKDLSNVNLIGCAALTDAAVDALIANCTKLEKIEYVDCPGLTARSVEACKKLHMTRLLMALSTGKVRFTAYDDDDYDDYGIW
eukprot:m.36311 g.36311  ORF g.36311 m.36311 type:complete len:1484 (+) comp12851_c0_seq1:350-4801(+)